MLYSLIFKSLQLSRQGGVDYTGCISVVGDENPTTIDSKSSDSAAPVSVLHSRNTNISGNKIKHNSRTSMNERTHFFIKIYLSHFILERVDVSVVCERWVERHILRERTSSSHIFFREPVGVPTLVTSCKLARDDLWPATCPSLDCNSLHSVQIWPCGSHHVISFRLHTCSTWVPKSCCPVY